VGGSQAGSRSGLAHGERRGTTMPCKAEVTCSVNPNLQGKKKKKTTQREEEAKERKWGKKRL